MIGKVRGGGARVSSSSTAPSSSSMIPSSTKKTIQNIKDVTGNDSESEIYAMLKECSMDPNETVTKLLLLDTFHEVKRKRDKKKDNSSKETAEIRNKTVQRGGHGGRSNHPPRYASHGATTDIVGKNTLSGKNNDNQHGKNEANISAPAIAAVGLSLEGDGANVEAKVVKPRVDSALAESDHIVDDSNSDSGYLSATTSPPSTAVPFSTADTVRVPGAGGISREPFKVPHIEKTGKVANKKHDVGKSNDIRPSSYNTRSSQTLPTHKVTGNKEWKPKSIPLPQSSSLEATVADEKPKVQKQEDVDIPSRQHVIIPNHIHVPESERSKLSFGSFDANFSIPSVTQESEGSSVSNNTEEIPQLNTPSPENTEAAVEAKQPPVECSASFEVSDSYPREVSRVQNIVVPQTFDPPGYYAPYYHAGADSDGRISPYLPKYSGNVVPEGLNVVPVPRSSPPQHQPCFRPPGLHLSHYPPNYIPYPHYFSPFYVPHFMGSQPGANAQVPVHPHVPGYSIPSVSSGGGTPTTEDTPNVFLTGQQSEGFSAWVPRDPFFNVPSHGQHVAFANLYGPPQPIPAAPGGSDMVQPVPNPYPQPQHQQINWPSNY